MTLFDLPPRSTLSGDAQVQERLKKKPSPATRKVRGKGDTLLDKIERARVLVHEHFKDVEEQYELIRTPTELNRYVDVILEQGTYAIDTETDSLDTFTANLAGIGLYTPGQRAAYVAYGHINPITNKLVDNQVPKWALVEQLARLRDARLENDEHIDCRMFNANYDVKILRSTMGIELYCTWDAMEAARILYELEPRNTLKDLYDKYVETDPDAGIFRFGDLFRGIPFTKIPLSVGYPYGASDAQKTYDLVEFQKPYLTHGTDENSYNDLDKVANSWHDIEIPVKKVIIDMEYRGIAFSHDKQQELEKLYGDQLAKADAELKRLIERDADLIDAHNKRVDAWVARETKRNQGQKITTPANMKRLEMPVNLNSPQQMATLIYDVYQIPENKGKLPKRGTGAEVLNAIGDQFPLTKALNDYRAVEILMGTFIKKMPSVVSEADGRVHTNYRQNGADTGRLSSNDPNMQNIPSRKGRDIRNMFTATDGHVLISSDYSGQEVRVAAHISGDKKLIKYYREGKDVYVAIAALIYNDTYESCLEENPDGTPNPEGKIRRNVAKAIVLGIMYGKSIGAIGADLGITFKESQEIYDRVIAQFPGLGRLVKESEQMARERGYVLTVYGRKRRLPNMQLPPFEFEKVASDNVLDFSEDDGKLSKRELARWTKLFNDANKLKGRTRWSQIESLKDRANSNGISVKDNQFFIAEATRQCVNSRVQGTAAEMIKKAMVLIGNDKKLHDWGFRLLLSVHDELVGECPEDADTVKKCANRFQDLMIEAAKDLIVPVTCDIAIYKEWDGDTLNYDL